MRRGLELAEKSSGLMALLIERSIIGLVFLVCLIFISAAGAIALGEYLGREWKGFLVVGTMYFIIGCFLLAMRKNLIRVPVMDTLIRYLFKSTSHEED